MHAHRSAQLAAACLLLLVAVETLPAGAELPRHPALSVEPPPAWAEIEAVALDGAPTVTVAAEGNESPDGEADGDSESVEEVHSVRWLLDDVQVQLPRRGPAQRFSRFAYRIETRSALESWSSWQTDFSPDHEQLVLHHLRIGRDGRWFDRLERSQASLLQREVGLESQTYDESRTLAVVLDDVRVGDVVDIAWSIRGGNPIFGGAYFDSFTLHSYQPTDLLRVAIDHPDSRPVGYKLYAGAPEPRVTRLPGGRRIAWEVRERHEIERESWVPAGILQAPWLQVSEFGSWSGVVSWALPYYGLSSRSEDDAALLAALEGLADTKSEDPWHQLAAVREFVQDDVRYFAHLMGPHSHAPHAPGDTLRRRYGDCKDKSFLMIHLLESLGIDAWPVFVHSTQGRVLADRLPSPGVFDHAIVGVAMPDGDVFLDPTLRLQGGVDQMWVPDYGWGLEVRPGTDALSRIASRPLTEGAMEITYQYDVPATGRTSEVTIETVYRGGRADRERDSWDGTDPAETLESFVEFYTNDYHKPTSKQPLQVADDRQANVIRIVEAYDLEYVPGEADTTTFETLPLQYLGQLPDIPWPPQDAGAEPEDVAVAEADPGDGAGAAAEAAATGASAGRPSATAAKTASTRKHPIRLPHPLHIVETVKLRTEEVLDWDLDDARIERPWLRFEVTQNVRGREMEIRYELETLAPEVPAESIADYRQVFDEIQEHTGVNIWNGIAAGMGDPTRVRALAVLTAALSFLTLVGFGSAIVQRRRGVL